MLDFGAVKCDSVNKIIECQSREPSDSIVQIRVKISSEVFRRSKHVDKGGLYISKETRSFSKGT